ncbi:hypothetical protein FRB90_001017 [Tulasnella sp. 427]|nr:hypothetical protein FRB90_001017 [Tulasnella sp. 427]
MDRLPPLPDLHERRTNRPALARTGSIAESSRTGYTQWTQYTSETATQDIHTMLALSHFPAPPTSIPSPTTPPTSHPPVSPPYGRRHPGSSKSATGTSSHASQHSFSTNQEEILQDYFIASLLNGTGAFPRSERQPSPLRAEFPPTPTVVSASSRPSPDSRLRYVPTSPTLSAYTQRTSVPGPFSPPPLEPTPPLPPLPSPLLQAYFPSSAQHLPPQTIESESSSSVNPSVAPTSISHGTTIVRVSSPPAGGLPPLPPTPGMTTVVGYARAAYLPKSIAVASPPPPIIIPVNRSSTNLIDLASPHPPERAQISPRVSRFPSTPDFREGGDTLAPLAGPSRFRLSSAPSPRTEAPPNVPQDVTANDDYGSTGSYFSRDKFKHRISMSSIFSKFSRSTSVSSKQGRFARRGTKKDLPPVPKLPQDPKEIKQSEADMALPALVNRAGFLSQLLESGRLPARTSTSVYHGLGSLHPPNTPGWGDTTPDHGSSVFGGNSASVVPSDTAPNATTEESPWEYSSGSGYVDGTAVRNRTSQSIRSFFTRGTTTDRSGHFNVLDEALQQRYLEEIAAAQQSPYGNEQHAESRMSHLQLSSDPGSEKRKRITIVDRPPPSRSLRSIPPPWRWKRHTVLAVTVNLALVFAVIATAVGLTWKQGGTGSSSGSSSGYHCSGNFTGSQCNLDATCICTTPGVVCNPLAKSLSDALPNTNTAMKTNYTAQSVALTLWDMQGSAVGGNCAQQALLLDISPSHADDAHLQWARSAVLWSALQSEDVAASVDLRKFVSALDYSKVNDGTADQFQKLTSGFLFDFAGMTVTPPSLTWRAAVSPSDAQTGQVSQSMESVLDQFYTSSNALSTQSSTALQNYWVKDLNLDVNLLPKFVAAVQSAPVLLPFDMTLGDNSQSLPSTMQLHDPKTASFPPPLGCNPMMSASQLAILNTIEQNAFKLPAVSTVPSSFDFSCFSSRPVYGVLDVMRLRMPFVDKTDQAPLQAAVLSTVASSRALIRPGTVLSLFPSVDSVDSPTSATRQKSYGTLKYLNHVLLAWLKSLPLTEASAIATFVATASPTSAPPLSLNTTTLTSIPGIEVALFGTIGPTDIDHSVSNFATPSGSLFFGSKTGSVFREWAASTATSATSIIWADSSASAKVVKEMVKDDSTFDAVWQGALTMITNANVMGKVTNSSDVATVVGVFEQIGMASHTSDIRDATNRGGEAKVLGTQEKASTSGDAWREQTSGAPTKSPVHTLAQSISSTSEKPNTSSNVDNKQSPHLVHERSWYERVPFVSVTADPPPASLDDAQLLPLDHANWLSRLTFEWMGPLLQTGYARPLEPADLWKMDDTRSAGRYARLIDESFERRQKEASKYNAKLDSGEIKPSSFKTVWWSIRGDKEKRYKEWIEKRRKKASLLWALNDAIKTWFWSGILIKAFGDTAQICSPLVIKEIIKFSSNAYYYHKGYPGTHKPNIGEGVGMSIGLMALMLFTTITTNQSMYRMGSSGVYLRGGLISSIFDRSLRLSNRARSAISNGKLIAHISTDVSRIDFALSFAMGATAPLQIIICLALLLANLGWSALPGFGLFFLVTPLQFMAMKRMFEFRKKAMVWTDKRTKLLQELLGGMRIIKFFAWEIPFLNRIAEFRVREVRYVRILLTVRSAINAVAFSLPVFAAVISFVAYALSGHSLDPAVIFASLTFFQLLRMPLMLLPVTLSSATDAVNAVNRLQSFYEAELQGATKHIDPALPVAIRVEHASFTWDAPPPDTTGEKKKGKLGKGKAKAPSATADESSSPKEERIFQLKDLTLDIPYGKLIAIVGPVGSGKSSLLQGMIGEMRSTSGKVTFGGKVAYCPQMAWIQSNSIRDNILFGLPYDEERYWSVVKASELEPDLAILPAGDMTEVGERGISLSGGQKQRINIARALYCASPITILDDPLSALDAHVGKAVFEQVIQTALAGTTRILVTHALHFLPSVDYIITMDGTTGTIGEQGTYEELIARNGAFARFMREFNLAEQANEKKEEEEDAIKEAAEEKKGKKGPIVSLTGPAIMQQEERLTGAVQASVYAAYFNSGHGKILVPLLIISLLFSQAANVMNSYWLVFWQERRWPYSSGFYMGVYAALGVAQAFGMFMMGLSFTLINYYSAKNLHRSAISRIMHAPMAFFDTTPLGRIMNRFTKDVDTLDNLIADAFRMLAGTLGQIVSTVVLVSVILPWFLLPVAVIMVFYYWGSVFYRASARELKRLDALLRSSLYAHYAESLSGLSTIRAYGESERFLKENRQRMDTENRAYFLTITNQRWLGIRLDALGSALTFFVALLAVVSTSISPSQTGLVLSYMLVVQQSFGWFVRQLAEVENDSNAIERILHYSKEIETEPPHQLPDRRPPNWPAAGHLAFRNVEMSYRPGLPTVLKDLSFVIEAGESIGIVGRSGAGKSSIMVALYRLAELKSGKIELDGIDISTLGLDDLRQNLAIIPQDPLLFSGTLRTNLDPFGKYDDALLWDALKRAHLVGDSNSKRGSADGHEQPSSEDVVGNRFTLDTAIEEEGANLSVGQRSLVSLARALVTPSTITLLDEATASVDYATDQLIQETIAREFNDRTLLCIAHRLRTILGYDRVCVMDAGRVAEFDTPLNLFAKAGGIFRSMCDRSGITEKDIRLARERN